MLLCCFRSDDPLRLDPLRPLAAEHPRQHPRRVRLPGAALLRPDGDLDVPAHQGALVAGSNIDNI